MMDLVVVVQSKTPLPRSLHRVQTHGLQVGSHTRIQVTRTNRPATRLDTRSPATVSTAAVPAASRVKVGLCVCTRKGKMKEKRKSVISQEVFGGRSVCLENNVSVVQ